MSAYKDARNGVQKAAIDLAPIDAKLKRIRESYEKEIEAVTTKYEPLVAQVNQEYMDAVNHLFDCMRIMEENRPVVTVEGEPVSSVEDLSSKLQLNTNLNQLKLPVHD